MVTTDEGAPVVEIFTDTEGGAYARCNFCPWIEDYRGGLDNTVQAAEIHTDHKHHGGA
jgi:hypothetical protein